MHVEWPSGRRTLELEVPDDATEDDIEGEAKDAFFNLCNYGIEIVKDDDNDE